jgi:L-threonylcarbamoyladenylate synthase
MGTRRRRVSVNYFISKLVKWDDLRMEIISNPTQVEIKKAAQALMDGHLVAFPTETVYGLGADATNEKAVSRVYSVKGRPTDHPLIVHISSINQLDKWAVDIPEYALKLANKFWPGPMTIILKRGALAKDFITGNQNSIGLRVPSHPLALSLINDCEKLGVLGISAPSANRYGAVSPTSANDVYDDIGKNLTDQDFILDGGNSKVGIESTIVDCTGPQPSIMRPGLVTLSEIRETSVREVIQNFESNGLRFPGSHRSHYSPMAQVKLNSQAFAGEGFLALSKTPTPLGAIRLGAPDTIEEFAQTLYKSLRMGDKLNLRTIVVEMSDTTEIGLAILDRITKSANKN